MKTFFFFGLLLHSLVAMGAVNVDVQPKRAHIGEVVALIIQIEGKLDREVELPDMDPIEVVGQQTQRGMTMGFGQGTGITTTITYHLKVDQVGSFVIPSFDVYADDQIYGVENLSFEILKQKVRNQDGNDVVFLERELSTKRIYVGQTFIDTLLLHSLPGSLRRGHVVEYQLKGARAVQTEKKDAFQADVQGTVYDVIPVHYVIIPGRSGSLNLPPHKAELSLKRQRNRRRGQWDPFDDFFQSNDLKEFWSPEESVEVLPLPAPQPNNFSGLVGDFSVTGSLNKHTLNVGETATLTLIIQGDGELGPLGQYEMKQIDGLKFYEDQPQDKEVFHQLGLQAERIMKFAVVATHAGEYNIQPHSLSVFSPRREVYENISFPPLRLMVKGANSSSNAMSLESKDDLSENSEKESDFQGLLLKDLKRKNINLSHGVSTQQFRVWVFLAVLPWLLKIIMIMIGPLVQRRKRGKDKREAYKKLRSLKKYKDLDGRFVLKAWIKYLNAFLHKNNENLTIQDIKDDINSEMLEQVSSIFKKLDEWSYSEQKLSYEQRQAILKDVLGIAKALEKSA